MTASPPPLPTRTELRRRLLADRQAWADSADALKAQAALEKKLLDALRQLEPECLGLYWPMRGEFNPRPAALLAQKEWSCRLVLPWGQRQPVQMHYRPWDGQDLSTLDECGIPSPPPPAAAKATEVVPDVVLVPCLGFTADGYRLGYGGGYFDRFLAAHPEVTAIGLAWAHAEIDVAALAIEPHDVPLMGVVTER